jgi:HEPN domain-containing protein
MSKQTIAHALKTLFDRDGKKLPETVTLEHEVFDLLHRLTKLIIDKEEDLLKIQQSVIPHNIIAMVDLRDTYHDALMTIDHNRDCIKKSKHIDHFIKIQCELGDAVQMFDNTLISMIERVT